MKNNVKMPSHMFNMEELLNQMSTKTTESPNVEGWISKIDQE